MAIAIFTHKVLAGKVEGVQVMGYTGTDIVLGSLLVFSSGLVALAGANPTSIVGVALQGYAGNPGFDAANSPATITGRQTTISVSRPNDSTIYAANLTNGTSTLVTPATADIGVSYGVTAYSGKWTVDKAKTGGDARVSVVGFDANAYGGIVFFKFLAAALAGA